MLSNACHLRGYAIRIVCRPSAIVIVAWLHLALDLAVLRSVHSVAHLKVKTYH